jgi:xylose isomerase
MGKRMEDHLRFAVAYWHSFAWPGGDPFGGQTFQRPWFGDTMELARLKADVAFEMFDILGRAVLLLPRRRRAARRRDFAESAATSRRSSTTSPRRWRRTAGAAPLGHGEPVHPPPLHGGGGDEPRPGRLRLCRATVKACIDATHKLGGQNYVLWGGREGYETLLNTDLKIESRAGRAVPVDGGRLQAQDRLQGRDPDRAEAAGAVQAPVRLRRRDGLWLPQALRAGEGGEGQHRAGPRDPGGAQLRARDRAGGEPRHLRVDRHEPERLPVGLGHRPVPEQPPEKTLAFYEILRAGGFTTGGTNFDAKIRRQSSTPRT